MATTIKIIFRALLLWTGAGGETVPVATGEAEAAEAGADADTVAPHFGQNFAPASSATPQELQKAISHHPRDKFPAGGVYRKLKEERWTNRN
jgi:hypothetical protein